MRRLTEEFKNRSIDTKKLIEYGFSEKEGNYIYEEYLFDEKFRVEVNYSKNKLTSILIDTETCDEYLLVDVPEIEGDFVVKLKKEYENRLTDIMKKCSIVEVFKSKQAKQVIKYAKNKYDDELEFLWTKQLSDNAIIRRKKDRKWYIALLKIPENKLGLDSDKDVEIIDLRSTTAEIQKIVDNEKYFPGYHMNKKHRITIKLDGSVDIERIYELIDVSYSMK